MTNRLKRSFLSFTISDLSEEDINKNIENDFDGSSDSELGMEKFNSIFKL